MAFFFDVSSIYNDLYCKMREWAKERPIEIGPSNQIDHTVIYGRISEVLCGNDFDWVTLEKIRDHICFLGFLNESDLSCEVMNCLETIRDACSNKNYKYTTSIKSWKEAVSLSLAFNRSKNKSTQINFNISARWKVVADAILFFRKYGIEMSIDCGEVVLPEEAERKIGALIEDRLDLLGENAIANVAGYLNKSVYRDKSQRYAFVGTSSHEMIPFGFIVNVGVRRMKKKKIPSNLGDLLGEFVSICTKYCSLYRCQIFNQYELMCIPREKLTEVLRRVVLSDQIYSFPQMAPVEALVLLEGMFADHDWAKLDVDLTSYMSVIRYVLIRANDDLEFSFSASDVLSQNIDANREQIKEALDTFTHKKNDINCGYVFPDNSCKLNYQFKPLVKEGKYDYRFILPSISSIGFYEVLSQKVRESGANDNDLGSAFENAIARALIRSNVQFKHGEKFKIDKCKRDELGIARDQGEIDFIIETENVVFLIEAKKKALTRKSRSGNVFEILRDVSRSYMASQFQGLIPKKILQKYGEITFRSGKTVKLNGRGVKTISLTLSSYLSFYCKSILTNMMDVLSTSKISVKGDSISQGAVGALNDDLEKIQTFFKSTVKDTSGVREFILESEFLCFSEFIYVLKDVSCTEEFSKIGSISYIVTGCRDFHQNYDMMSKNSQLKGIEDKLGSALLHLT